jgi:hypothetical protein
MTERDIFNAWAPLDSPWSRWAKPALFAQMENRRDESVPPPLVPAWGTWLAERRPAVIIDLPGEEAIALGLSLAASHRYRPVPLFNTSFGFNALIPVGGMIGLLHRNASALQARSIPPDAPPAFLLDENRMNGSPSPGRYDNRWLVLPQDFPSANSLLAHRISDVLLVQREIRSPRDDLAHVVLRYQEAGLSIFAASLSSGSVPQIIRVNRPPRYRALWYQFLVVLGLRRNSAGGFGAVVPNPSSGGGFA